MKIGVVGTIIRDLIVTSHDQVLEAIGGIYFTVSYLAHLMSPDDLIYPVAFVGSDFYEEVCGEFRAFPNIRLSGLTRIAQDNTRVKLTEIGGRERTEIISNKLPPLTINELRLIRDSDAVIVNLIAGNDVELAALQEFRRISDALIYLDFHSQTRGIDQDGRRFYRYPEDWKDWMGPVDAVQLNEREAGALNPGRVRELDTLGKEIIGCGPTILHITQGERGSRLFCSKAGATVVSQIGVESVDAIVDTIGCGDAFEAAFLVKYLETRDVEAATRFAHKVARLNCLHVGSTGIASAVEILREQ